MLSLYLRFRRRRARSYNPSLARRPECSPGGPASGRDSGYVRPPRRAPTERQEASHEHRLHRGPRLVRHVILNRPEKRNAMNQELLLALGRGAARGGRRPLESTASCCGAKDPCSPPASTSASSAQSAGEPGAAAPVPQVFLDCANLCEEMAKPVVCQIRRACLGGALEVALGCDLRVADSESQLGPARRSSSGSSPTSAARPGCRPWSASGRAKELIMTARTIGAQEASDIGLVNRVVPPAELERRHRGARRGAARQLPHRRRAAPSA